MGRDAHAVGRGLIVRLNPRVYAPVASGIALLAIYVATLAPSVTFWDAGEFIAAAHSLGIPHPPGTPLFILVLNVWARALGFLSFAYATNLFSAFATAVAGAGVCWLVATWCRARGDDRHANVYGIAAALCAGTMSSVWLNATETEVYAASLCLSVLMLVAGERASHAADRRPGRWVDLLAYLFGCAAALHVSALVAAPAAIFLAVSRDDDVIDVARALELLAVATLAMAIGSWNAAFAGIALVLVIAAIALRRSVIALRGPALTVLAATALAFMLVRAGFDPPINQGNPSSWTAFTDVIGRAQYDLPGLWPRRSPLWAQIGNWFEFADWQVALSLGPTVIPTVPRTAMTLAFAALAVFGASAQRRTDPRAWMATLVLVLCGSLGVVLYLNLRPTPSFGWGVLPDDMQHEARERDYFFVLGFLAWGIWAGQGAIALAKRRALAPALGLAVAVLPAALNWGAVRRNAQPDASVPRAVAATIIAHAPPRSILLLAGDNDTYPLWHGMVVDSIRTRHELTRIDSATVLDSLRVDSLFPVTVPLLGAAWYRDELHRRWNILPAGASGSTQDLLRMIARRADSTGRYVTSSLALEQSYRNQIKGCWTVGGLTLLRVKWSDDGVICENRVSMVTQGDSSVPVTAVDWGDPANRTTADTVYLAQYAASIEAWAKSRKPRESIDGTTESMFGLLRCPGVILDSLRKIGRQVSLDSICNSR
jgi:hypothetical protein